MGHTVCDHGGARAGQKSRWKNLCILGLDLVVILVKVACVDGSIGAGKLLDGDTG
jgi:hypothetical protein